MTASHPTPARCQWFSWPALAFDRRSASRLAFLFLGTALARGRHTVTAWMRAAKLSDRYHSCYLAAADRWSDQIAQRPLTEVVRSFLKDATRLPLALDDIPTKRYGAHF